MTVRFTGDQEAGGGGDLGVRDEVVPSVRRAYDKVSYIMACVSLYNRQGDV